ncbi:hypothetical protein FXO38_29045 [Capsicum annuum]|nr:hypothetical protein FXO37_30237 [Capsicum annuum]KAF3626816.1 hypothetical protein FXO38_29045 [Capsicum annuum]
MATPSGGNSLTEESVTKQKEEKKSLNCSGLKYSDLLKPKVYVHDTSRVPPKLVIVMHGEPSVTRKSSEVRSLIVQENLQYTIIGKFSYGKPDITELQKSIPTQYGIKSDYTIGVMYARLILIRLGGLEDYVQLLST